MAARKTEIMRSMLAKDKIFLISLGVAFISSLLLWIPSSAAGQKKDLPPVHKTWLEEEVIYIITPLEKEVFRKLTTDRERDIFIEAFWKHRDPTPGTPENEFKAEHFRRINFVNHFYGRGSPKLGWQTDRGRIYIILGEPNEIHRFEGKSITYPAEVWFYQGKTDVGLPAGFYVVFFQPGNVGEYRLFSPSQDGPQALLTSYLGYSSDYLAAYNELKEHEPLLAEVSMSLIPGETSAVMGRSLLSSDLLIHRVETTAQRTVEAKYAHKFLQYKDIIEVEYSANFIDSDGLFKLTKDPSGVYFVHFSIEPERLSIGQYEKRFYTTLKMNGSVITPEGKLIHQFDRSISMNFDEVQIVSISRQPLSIHEMFPLIPGEYRFSVLVKNEVSKEFTSIEWNLVIPVDEPAVQMTSPTLAYKVVPVVANRDSLKPFRFGGYQVYAQPNRVFLKKDTLGVVFQVHGLDPGVRERADL
ncbi:MAG: GWxTD domain-containing protein, partial [Candidatus Aminicenantales bacterium]